MQFSKAAIWGLAAVIALAGAPAFAQMKIGVLDYGRLMDESPQGKALLETLRAEATAKQRELQTQATQLRQKQEKLTKDRATMSADQVSRAEKEIRDGQRDLARRQQEIEDDFNARRNEEVPKLERLLFQEVTAYAKSQNFDLVLSQGVFYATPAIDITPAILQALQARGGAAAPAAPAAGSAPRPAGR